MLRITLWLLPLTIGLLLGLVLGDGPWLVGVLLAASVAYGFRSRLLLIAALAILPAHFLGWRIVGDPVVSNAVLTAPVRVLTILPKGTLGLADGREVVLHGVKASPPNRALTDYRDLVVDLEGQADGTARAFFRQPRVFRCGNDLRGKLFPGQVPFWERADLAVLLVSRGLLRPNGRALDRGYRHELEEAEARGTR